MVTPATFKKGERFVSEARILEDGGDTITVIADDREVFRGRVERSVETLMGWAAKDNDRTMLYGAELTLRLD